MVVEHLYRVRLLQPTHLLIEILIRLFTLGIFSVEGGAKAWFELVLVIGALSASGYLLWWEIPLLFAAIILGTLAAGMFSVLLPQYMEVNNVNSSRQVALGIPAISLEVISRHNLNQLSTLSNAKMQKRLEEIYRAKLIIESNLKAFEGNSKLQLTFDNINQSYEIAERLESRRREVENQKIKEEVERKRKWEAWLKTERVKEGFTGGCPPDGQYDPPRCRDGYPVKVTLNKKEDGFSGIIWKPSDKEYNSVIPKWCYSSVQEAESERGKYRFRRPKNSRGKPRS